MIFSVEWNKGTKNHILIWIRKIKDERARVAGYCCYPYVEGLQYKAAINKLRQLLENPNEPSKHR